MKEERVQGSFERPGPFRKENFADAVQTARLWIKDLLTEMDTENESEALSALRAVLHTFRDKLVLDESAHLAAQLPTLIRGIYFEGWDPSKAAVEKLRRKEEFVEHVRVELFGSPQIDPEKAAVDVFRLLSRKISKGEIKDVKQNLTKEISAFLGEAETGPVGMEKAA